MFSETHPGISNVGASPPLGATGGARQRNDGLRPALTGREIETLELIARGLSYGDIARVKGISVHTVHTHVKNIFGKLMVHSKTEAVFEAASLGLLCPISWFTGAGGPAAGLLATLSPKFAGAQVAPKGDARIKAERISHPLS